MTDPTYTEVQTVKDIRQMLDRIAYQVYEDNFEENDIIVAGIATNGFILAERLAAKIAEISPIRVRLIEVVIDKHDHIGAKVQMPLSATDLNGKVVILVDDVLNSGKTLIYSMLPFFTADLKKLRTAILVDRNHKRYPVSADFVGLSLSTTLQEHIHVILNETNEGVYLS